MKRHWAKDALKDKGETINNHVVDGDVSPDFDAYKQNRKYIMEAYQFLRKENHTIPDEILDFMLRVSLEEMHP